MWACSLGRGARHAVAYGTQDARVHERLVFCRRVERCKACVRTGTKLRVGDSGGGILLGGRKHSSVALDLLQLGLNQQCGGIVLRVCAALAAAGGVLLCVDQRFCRAAALLACGSQPKPRALAPWVQLFLLVRMGLPVVWGLLHVLCRSRQL